MTHNIQQNIIDYLTPATKDLFIEDVRIGLGYTCVQLSNGESGLAWTAKNVSGSCTHLHKAGTLVGRKAKDLLEMLKDPHQPLCRTLGLATANALTAGLPRPESSHTDVLELADIKSSDHVAMVGFFAPLMPPLRKSGCRLDVIELDSSKPGVISPEEGKASLAACDVAIITATSVVTQTIDDILKDLGHPRFAVMLGPSTLMCPKIFADSPLTHLAGSRILDVNGVKTIVSEGGGTRVLKQFLDFEVISI